MQWFRLHDDVLDDPKVQKLSPQLFKHWINLLCLASKNNPRGTLPDLNTIAFRLRLSDDKAWTVLSDLISAGLIEHKGDGNYEPHNWNKRQYDKPSDHPERVTARVRKHRNADVTPLKRAETPLYTDTDTDTEKSTPPVSPSPGEPKPTSARTIKTPVPENFLNDLPPLVWSSMGREQNMNDDELRRETEKMVDHFKAKGERRADWVATWRNWMRSDYRKPRGSPHVNGREDATITADRDKVLAVELANDPQAYLSWGKR